MSPERLQRGGKAVPSFEGEAQAFPEEERTGEFTALGVAIAEAATAAAAHLAANDLDERTFEVTQIRVVVAPNPGPTSYKVVITPGG